VPGEISSKLRKALGLERDHLPKHIYMMRLLGYPPGWMEEARISHSGLALYDSQGRGKCFVHFHEGPIYLLLFDHSKINFVASRETLLSSINPSFFFKIRRTHLHSRKKPVIVHFNRKVNIIWSPVTHTNLR
jgi:hypothetical protein